MAEEVYLDVLAQELDADGGKSGEVEGVGAVTLQDLGFAAVGVAYYYYFEEVLVIILFIDVP